MTEGCVLAEMSVCGGELAGGGGEIGHSGMRVFTKPGMGCGTYNIQANMNSPWAISRLDDSGLGFMRAEI